MCNVNNSKRWKPIDFEWKSSVNFPTSHPFPDGGAPWDGIIPLCWLSTKCKCIVWGGRGGERPRVKEKGRVQLFWNSSGTRCPHIETFCEKMFRWFIKRWGRALQVPDIYVGGARSDWDIKSEKNIICQFHRWRPFNEAAEPASLVQERTETSI